MSEISNLVHPKEYERVFKRAVAEAIEEHRRMGRSIVVMREGKIVEIPPDQIKPLNPDQPMPSSKL